MFKFKYFVMKKNYSFFLLTVGFLFGFALASHAQISQGGTPPSFENAVTNDFDHQVLQAPDMDKIRNEDMLEDAAGGPGPRRMGVSVIVNKGIDDAGTWTELPGGGKIWRLELEAPGALALGVYYDDFFIPEGGKLFLYNDNRNQVIGAYTAQNNPKEHLFSTEFIQGDKVVLEYYQPAEVTKRAHIHISELAYAYRDIDFNIKNDRDAWWCMIDVACEEGDDWQNQIKGVARISIKIGYNYYWCSGSLINNTNNDRTPYFLTASHCGEGASASDLNQWIFYFNYQASTCNGTATGYNSMSGCQLKAKDPSHADNGSDFYLVEFNNNIPDFFDVFYNGWNRTNSNEDAGNGVSIHHPAGDIKKISTYNTPLMSSTFWNGLPSHWRVTWAQTVNGRSIVQGGSSGSPIFDSNGLIMGDLTGGYASNSCTNPSPAFYGKIWYSWDHNGTTPSTRLKDWLDPGNTGREKLPGISWQIIPPTADFTADTTEIIQSDTVWFTDQSEPGILSWDWDFTGGVPDSSTVQNPYTVYYDTGYFDVSLTVTNADGTDTETKTAYIHVSPMAPPTPDFDADNTVIAPGGKVHFTDLSTGDPNSWYWEFEGASPSSSTLQNPLTRYSSVGTYKVKLVVTNWGGSDSLIRENYITVTNEMPEADFEASNNNIMMGDSINFTDMSTGSTPTRWYWSFPGAVPDTSNEQNPQNIVYPQAGLFTVSLKVENGVGESTATKENYIHVDWVGIISDIDNRFDILPNPNKGNFSVVTGKKITGRATVKIFNYNGTLVFDKRYDNIENAIKVNLTGQPAGTYLLKIICGDDELSGKFTLIK
jgi:PKD repeat protein